MLPWNKKISFNYQEMEQNLIKNASEEYVSDEDKYYEALEQINKAATIFEEAGLNKVSSLLDDLLMKLAKAEELSSKKQIENLKSHGWPFNKPKDMNNIDVGLREGPGEYLREEQEAKAIEEDPGLTDEEIKDILSAQGLNAPTSSDKGIGSFEGPTEHHREQLFDHDIFEDT